jgi:sulfite reductase alpha subunit-like flavoprotein
MELLRCATQFALAEFDLAVFVLSSTGEGEPPDNARSFWRFLARKTHPKDLMARLKFTVLGTLPLHHLSRHHACTQHLHKGSRSLDGP